MLTQSLVKARPPVHWTLAGSKRGLFSENLPRLFVPLVVLMLAPIPALSATAWAQGSQGEEIQQPAPAGALEIGKLLYEYNCGSCHGESLTGDGPVAKVLKTPPSDLTLLAKHDGGKYPRAEIYDYVVGTKTVVAHGTRKMPVWSLDLYAPTGPFGLNEGPLTKAERRQRVNEIVDYIATKQVK